MGDLRAGSKTDPVVSDDGVGRNIGSSFPAKAGIQGSGNRCFAPAWAPAYAGEQLPFGPSVTVTRDSNF